MKKFQYIIFLLIIFFVTSQKVVFFSKLFFWGDFRQIEDSIISFENKIVWVYWWGHVESRKIVF